MADDHFAKIPVTKKSRYQQAHQLRLEGKTYQQIGDRLGVSSQRTAVMVTKFDAALLRKKRS